MSKNHSERDCTLLVFTDLDGTLLDHETYSFKPALPALAVLRENRIPLIFCTSKTRAEIEIVRVQLNNTHPFISENGGAIFIPRGYFFHETPCSREDSRYRIIELGTPYSQVRSVFEQICSALPGKLQGFGDCTPGEIASLCGLTLADAERALKREYDEPFVARGEVSETLLEEIAHRSRLRVNRGGRFYHLAGNNDKGIALRRLRDVYRQQSDRPAVVAFGDSENDLSMLEAVDYPILVRKKDGSYLPGVALKNLRVTRKSGPAGWSETLLELLPSLGIG